MGNYPVGKDDAAQMSALQILVDIGYVDGPESCTSVFFFLDLLFVSNYATYFSSKFDLSPVSYSFLLVLSLSMAEYVEVLMPFLYAKLFSCLL